jgi:transcriptional regulator with XRE-family HTH domain
LAEAHPRLRQLTGRSQRVVGEAIGTSPGRVGDYERGRLTANARTVMRHLAALGYGLAIVPLIGRGPETAPASTVSDQRVEMHTRVGSDDLNGAEARTEGGDWNWTPTTDGGWYSGPHGPDVCPRMGCRHEGGAA